VYKDPQLAGWSPQVGPAPTYALRVLFEEDKDKKLRRSNDFRTSHCTTSRKYQCLAQATLSPLGRGRSW